MKYRIEQISIGDEITYKDKHKNDSYSIGRVISRLDDNIFIEIKGNLFIETIIIDVADIVSLVVK